MATLLIIAPLPEPGRTNTQRIAVNPDYVTAIHEERGGTKDAVCEVVVRDGHPKSQSPFSFRMAGSLEDVVKTLGL